MTSNSFDRKVANVSVRFQEQAKRNVREGTITFPVGVVEPLAEPKAGFVAQFKKGLIFSSGWAVQGFGAFCVDCKLTLKATGNEHDDLVMLSDEIALWFVDDHQRRMDEWAERDGISPYF